MRIEEFHEQSSGQLVRIQDGWAFVPARLPPGIGIDWDLAQKMDDASRAIAKLDGQASQIQNTALIIRPLLTREAVESARLEGTHTHIAGVLLHEAAGPPSDPNEAINNREVLNYLRASFEGEAWLREGRPLNLPFIRSLHSLLLVGTRGEQRRPGEFRSGQVFIGTHGDTPETARFVPPPPEHVQPAIEELVGFVNNDGPYPPLIKAGIVHYQFEAIHPFEDGNGRLGRLLIPLQLMACNTIEQPLVYLSPFFESRRDDYLQLLKGVSTHGAWTEWLSFFLEAVRSQAEDARSRAERLLALQAEYRSRSQSEAKSKVAIVAVDLILERLIISAPELAEYAKCNYRTARSALETLAKIGILETLQPEGYRQRWWAHDLIKQIYEK